MLAGGGAVSALAPTFTILVAARGVAGLALGTFTWLAWSEVFGDREKMGDVSVIGPASGALGVPLVGVVLELADFRVLFAAQALLALVPLVRVPTFADVRTPTVRSVRHRPVAAAVMVIAALGLLTAGGSATFAYAGVIARDEIGMGAGVLALLLSANALAGIPSARWRGERRLSGGWALATAVCALVLAIGRSASAFSVAIVAWGFFFWAGIPGLFTLLSDRSRHPAERAGDAQAVMAAGRVIGPLVGGAAIGAGSFVTLGVVSAVILSIGGGLALAVELQRRPVTRTGAALDSP